MACNDPFEIDAGTVDGVNQAAERMGFRQRICATCGHWFKQPVCQATDFIGAAAKCYTCLRANDPPNKHQTPEVKAFRLATFLKLFEIEGGADDEA